MSNAPDLHAHSHYSMLDGMGSPKAIVERAIELDWPAAALTDHGHLMGAPEFYKACKATRWWKNNSLGKQEGEPKPVINPILGCEFYVVADDDLGVNDKTVAQSSYHLTVLALSREGYQNLVAWTTFANRRENFYNKPRISLEQMEAIAPWPLHHNVVLSGCLGSELCSALVRMNGQGTGLGRLYVESMKSLFPHFYIECQRHEHPKFMGKGFDAYERMVTNETIALASLLDLAQITNTPIVVTNDSHFQRASERQKHLAMKASAWRSRDDDHFGRSKERLMREFLPDYVYLTAYLQSMERVAARVPGGEKALESVMEIANEADVRLDPFDNFSYSIPFSGYDDPIKQVRKVSAKRLKRLIFKHGRKARERFEMELTAMGDFAHYLLLMSDFIRYARSQGILTNTRGSAANSLVCYCLEIHDIDPIEYDLLFSRFVNPSRKKLPDIDVDVEKDRYDDFMAYVKERMEILEGEGQVVQICNIGTFANRSAFRTMCETLGVEKERIDELAKLLPQMIDSGMVDEESDAYEALKEEAPEIYELAVGVFDAPRNVSQHACGWLLGTRDRPIKDWIPLTLIASSNSLVTQYNMKVLEDAGLTKGDFLRLRTLSVIQRTRRMLGQSLTDITDIPLDDPETFQMLREGRTEGIFTLQGKENRRGVMEVEAKNVHDVIASVAIYRPALTREGLNKVYNERRKSKDRDWLDEIPAFARPALAPTYGVPIFQEQVMEIAYAAGMSDEEVDEVYRAIKLAKGVGRGAKEAFATIKPKFMAAAKRARISKEDRRRGWHFIRGSQGYGFNRGHASSYGILAVRAAYLRCHHPAEFFTALLDVYPEKTKYIAAAKAEGFSLLPPDVNLSGRGFTLDDGGIRVGLDRIAKLGPVGQEAVLANQPFASAEDFRERVTKREVNTPTFERLCRLGFFESIGIKGAHDDALEFEMLGFTLRKPQALRGLRIRHVRKGESENGWKNLGLARGVEFTEWGSSCVKLFWIPPNPDRRGYKLLDTKASAWAQVKTHLLTAIDQNGLPFHVMVNEDKRQNAEVLRWAANHRGCVLALEGSIRQPFLADGPLGFRMYRVCGNGFPKDPQVWLPGASDGDVKKAKKRLVQIGEMK